ncbi:MAG: 50S ribosomal protein L6 [archaeon]
MKKELFQEIKIPEGVQVELKESTLTVKGPEGENKRDFDLGILEFKKEGDRIIIGNKKSTKREKKRMKTIIAHINNMIKGVQEKFEYTLKICYSHFPFTVDVSEKEALIKNFLGEKIPRKTNIPEGVEIKTDKQNITIKSVNKELAGQAAANFEKVTKVRGRDRRIFQDGIFLINKAGKEI